jgi:hypothetical protein
MSNTPNPPQEQDLSRQAYSTFNPPPSGGMATSGSTGVSAEFIPPPRPEYAQTQNRGKTAGIIDANGTVLPYYELSTRPGEILGGLDDVSRKNLVDKLYSHGWYGGGKPQGGFGDADRDAMRTLLYYSNTQGVDYRTVLATVAKAPIAAGSGRQVQVASSADLIEIANRTALSTIGRKLSEAEAAQFARSYQGVQRSSAGATQAAPSADIFFQNRIQQKYGAETDGYKYLSAISNVAKLLENI